MGIRLIICDNTSILFAFISNTEVLQLRGKFHAEMVITGV